MENFGTKNLYDYEPLRQEIKDLKAEEMAKKEKNPKNYNPHFDDIEPNFLTNQDLNIYKEYKEGTLTLEKFSEYRNGFHKIENENDPRLNFMAWLANKTITPEWIKKWQPEIYKAHFEGKDKEQESISN